jgi:wyosine [tRNA(Phe)-imidazoG37] synthetase (radical SAM superfamily)
MIVYGPVPSRRLGRSLGVNHVPPKTCTYSCVYCQLGRTNTMISDRRKFYDPNHIVELVEKRLKKKDVDYVTFVPDGEPTLDVNLGKMIKGVNQLGVNTAVICNSSLLWMEDVRNDLEYADWVSIKTDAITENIWKKIDRPHGKLKHTDVIEGMLTFSETYKGTLSTETMLVNNLNDGEEPRKVAKFLKNIDPDIAYVAIPTRPPAEKWVKPVDEATVNQTYQVFSKELRDVEYLIGYEGNAFASTGNFEEDILSITSVHPMREEGVKDLIRNDEANWDDVERLIDSNKLVELSYLDNLFYMRKISSR